jgi:GNAT superfamily N-acetyltransferase
MPSISIRPCTVSDMENAHNLAALLAEYGVESAIEGLGQPSAQIETYRQMEALGMLCLIGAFQGDELVGFLIMIVSVLPHYGKRIASTESFFVASAARKGGAGLKLLCEAERLAKSLGAMGFFVSAPTNSRLDSVLTAKQYRHTNQVFFKVLA